MKLVILDRDGVINRDSADFIKSAAEWHPLPGALEAIARFTNTGYTVAVATNQSGIARGLFDIETLHDIHQTMLTRAAALGGRIDAIAFCPHGPSTGCACRKPKPGLLRELGQRFAVPMDQVPVIGDALRDLRAAKAAGARPILVRTGKGAETAAALPVGFRDVPVAADLAGAADLILTGEGMR